MFRMILVLLLLTTLIGCGEWGKNLNGVITADDVDTIVDNDKDTEMTTDIDDEEDDTEVVDEVVNEVINEAVNEAINEAVNEVEVSCISIDENGGFDMLCTTTEVVE